MAGLDPAIPMRRAPVDRDRRVKPGDDKGVARPPAESMSYFELMGFGPKGWGWPMLLAAGMTVAVASCGFLVGSALGSLIAWAKLSEPRAEDARRRLHHGAARHPGPPRHLPLLPPRQRRAEPRGAAAPRRGRLRQPSRRPAR